MSDNAALPVDEGPVEELEFEISFLPVVKNCIEPAGKVIVDKHVLWFCIGVRVIFELFAGSGISFGLPRMLLSPALVTVLDGTVE
jgi:hypothetical protein